MALVSHVDALPIEPRRRSSTSPPVSGLTSPPGCPRRRGIHGHDPVGGRWRRHTTGRRAPPDGRGRGTDGTRPCPRSPTLAAAAASHHAAARRSRHITPAVPRAGAVEPEPTIGLLLDVDGGILADDHRDRCRCRRAHPRCAGRRSHRSTWPDPPPVRYRASRGRPAPPAPPAARRADARAGPRPAPRHPRRRASVNRLMTDTVTGSACSRRCSSAIGRPTPTCCSTSSTSRPLTAARKRPASPARDGCTQLGQVDRGHLRRLWPRMPQHRMRPVRSARQPDSVHRRRTSGVRTGPGCCPIPSKAEASVACFPARPPGRPCRRRPHSDGSSHRPGRK